MQANFIEPFFWDRFAEINWEKKEFYSDSVFNGNPLDEKILFDAVVDCCANKAEGIFINFHIEGTRHKYEPGNPLYPKASDGSFTGFHERMKRELNGKKYCCIINSLEIQSFEVWNWGRHFLNGLFERIGFNKIGVVTNLFIGSDRTPFGIHQDIRNDSVFHVPVIGKKGMRLWPSDYHVGKPGFDGAREYAAYLADSRLIEANAGGMIYWPSGLWHTSEEVDEFSVSLAVALSCYRNTSMLLLDLMRNFAEQQDYMYREVTFPYHPAAMNSGTTEIPEEMLETKAYIEEAVSYETLLAQWSKIVTGFNFAIPTIPLLPVSQKIDAGNVISKKASFPIIHVKLNEKIGIAANGHILKKKYDEGAVELVNLLNSGNQLKAGELHEAAGSFSRDEVDDILRWLESVRAIEVGGQPVPVV